jgi:thiol-disulfide isomerase/thioredoxin
MKIVSRRIALFGLVLGVGFWSSGAARGEWREPWQDEPAVSKPKVLSPAGAGATLQSIQDEYNRQLLHLEQQRLERLGQLALRQSPKDALETYEMLFRLAIANNLFREAEPFAQQVLKSSGRSPGVDFLAHTIDIIASADMGNIDASVAEFRRLFDVKNQPNRPAQGVAAALDTSDLLSICEAYYQRLIQGERFDTVRAAFQLVLRDSDNPAVKAYCANRLNQLALVGKPAPALQGTDLDGKPVSLADFKDQVVLVVFWASWCLPCSSEIPWLDQVYTTHQARGLRIVGVNLDALQNDTLKVETMMPNVRRFILDHNIRWPNLMNGTGANDYARAYGVAEIPANVLIGRDGNVIHLDLTRKNLNTVIARSMTP